METLRVEVSVRELLAFYNSSSVRKKHITQQWFGNFFGDISDANRRATGLALTVRKVYLKLHSKDRPNFLQKTYMLKFKRYRDDRWQEFARLQSLQLKRFN